MEEPALGLIGRLAALDGEQVLLDLDVQFFGPEAGDGDLRARRLDVLVLSGGRGARLRWRRGRAGFLTMRGSTAD